MGRDAVMRQVKQLRDTWDADTLELNPATSSTPGDRVAVRSRLAGRRPWPGVETFGPTHVLTVRKGKIVGVEVIRDHAEALGTLGLSEQDARTHS